MRRAARSLRGAESGASPIKAVLRRELGVLARTGIGARRCPRTDNGGPAGTSVREAPTARSAAKPCRRLRNRVPRARPGIGDPEEEARLSERAPGSKGRRRGGAARGAQGEAGRRGAGGGQARGLGASVSPTCVVRPRLAGRAAARAGGVVGLEVRAVLRVAHVGVGGGGGGGGSERAVAVGVGAGRAGRVGRGVVVMVVVVVVRVLVVRVRVRGGRRRVQAVERVVGARHGRRRRALLLLLLRRVRRAAGRLCHWGRRRRRRRRRRLRRLLRRRRLLLLRLLRLLLPELHEGGFGGVLRFQPVSHRSHGHHPSRAARDERLCPARPPRAPATFEGAY